MDEQGLLLNVYTRKEMNKKFQEISDYFALPSNFEFQRQQHLIFHNKMHF